MTTATQYAACAWSTSPRTYASSRRGSSRSADTLLLGSGIAGEWTSGVAKVQRTGYALFPENMKPLDKFVAKLHKRDKALPAAV